MAYTAKIVCDSIGPSGKRITTFEVTYPKFVHNELMTHRMFSRNTASSRAIPYVKTREQVLNDPVIPVWWGKNQAGMQAKEELVEFEQIRAIEGWLSARNSAVARADNLVKLNVHKQIVNRIIEPWMWITAIITATEYANFFHLRCHPDAQPEIQKIAYMMSNLYYYVEPIIVPEGGWHLPYIYDEDIDIAIDELSRQAGMITPLLKTDTYLKRYMCMLSVARCARVSYLTHDGVRNHEEDIKLYNRLHGSGHWSPFEHVAQALPIDAKSGNFIGWKQYRKYFADENITNYSLPND